MLERKRTVHFHSHRADDLMTAMRLAEEFDFELVLQHATEGYRIADELVRRKVPVSLTLVDSPGGKLEAAGLLEENAAMLDKAGVKVAINTDDSITESRFFLRTGAIAVRGGMSEDAALRALTMHGAQMLHLDDRLGSLEKGKDADFVVLSGPPFSVYTQVLQTYIDGATRLRPRRAARTGRTRPAASPWPTRERLPQTPPPRQAASRPWHAPAPPNSQPTLERRADALRHSAPAASTPSARATITDGVVLVEDGKIKAVGTARQGASCRPDLPVLTAAVVTPGLIDAHTVVGLSGALQPAGRPGPGRDERSQPGRPARAGRLQSQRAAAGVPAPRRASRWSTPCPAGPTSSPARRASSAPRAAPPSR